MGGRGDVRAGVLATALLVGLAWTSLLAGCGESSGARAPATTVPPADAATGQDPEAGGAGTPGDPGEDPGGEDPGGEDPGGEDPGEGPVIVAETDRPIELRTAPQETSPPRSLAPDPVSGRSVLLVVQQLGGWVQVRLPTGPDGERAWVQRDDVALSRHAFRIEVSRDAHVLTVRDGDAEVLREPVALGPQAPPAGSSLFVTSLVSPPGAGPYGSLAYGLSGSVLDLAALRSGSGVAIHGTSDVAALGGDAPAGAIAVGDEAVERMVESLGLPLGTPVDVVA